MYSFFRFSLLWLLLSALLAPASAQENKPDYYGADATHYSFSNGIIGTSTTSASLACAGAGALEANYMRQNGSGGNFAFEDCTAPVVTQVQYTVPGVTPDIVYFYASTRYTVRIKYTGADGVLSYVTFFSTVKPMCDSNNPWATSVTCACLEGQGQTRAGYFDAGYVNGALSPAPLSYCRNPLSVGTGCTWKGTQQGAWWGSEKGIRHRYIGMVYQGSAATCSADTTPPLKDFIGADACPTGYAFKFDDGVQICKAITAASGVSGQATGCTATTDPCYFVPGTTPTVGTPAGGGGSGSGIGGGATPTDPNAPPTWSATVCGWAGVSIICDWFKPTQPTNDLASTGNTALSSAAALIPGAAMPSLSILTATTGTCAIDQNMQTPWGAVSIGTGTICTLAGQLRPIIIMAGLIMAGFIVFRRS